MPALPASFKQLPLLSAVGAFGFISATLLREYNSGGIKAHHFLQQKDMPALSNAWGLLILPLLGWAAGYFLNKRFIAATDEPSKRKVFTVAVLSFAAALVAGFAVSWLFLQDQMAILEWVPLFFLVTALLLPVYRFECLLGFVVGMTHTFGPVIPLIFGGLFVLISALVQRFLWPKLRSVFLKRR